MNNLRSLFSRPAPATLPDVGDRLQAWWGQGCGYSEGTCVGFKPGTNRTVALVVDQDNRKVQVDRLRVPGDLSPIGWTKRNAEKATSAEVFALISAAYDQEMKAKTAKAAKEAKRDELVAKGRDVANRLDLAQYPALVVAMFKKDESDSQSDYFATSTKKLVVLGVSSSTRVNFKEFRKMALRYEATKGMAENGIEHRENYSMGAGTYLSENEGIYCTGWVIKKRTWGMMDTDVLEALGELNLLDG